MLCSLFVYSQIKDARLVVQNGHSYHVNQAIFSPNGNYVASCSSDNTIILWDATSGKQIRTFTGHKDEVRSICFSNDGNLLYSASGSVIGSQDNSIKVWDIHSGKCIRTINYDQYVFSLVRDISGKYLISLNGGITKGHIIKILDQKNLTEIKTLSIDENSSIDFFPTGNLLVYSSNSNDIVVSDLSGNIIEKSTGYSYEAIPSVKWSSDGKYIISSQGYSRSNTENSKRIINLWEYPSLKKIKTFVGHKDLITSVCFSPDNKYILSGSFDNTVRLWDIQTGNEVKVFRGHTDHVSSVSFSPDGKSIVSASWDNSVKIWNLSSGELSFTLNGKIQPEYNLTYSNDGNFLFAGTNNGFIVWDMVNLSANSVLLSDIPKGFSIALSQDNSRLICWNHDRIYLWDRVKDQLKEINNTIGYLYNIAISPNNEIIAISDKTSISLMSLNDGNILGEITVDGKFQDFRFVFTPDGNSLIIAKAMRK